MKNWDVAPMIAVVKKHYGENGLGLLEKLYPAYAKNADRYPMFVTCTSQNDGYKAMFVFGFRGICHPIQFSLEYYPACCGIRMFHSFMVQESLPQEFVDEFMNAWVAGDNKGNKYLGASRRIEVIMVEGRDGLGYDATQEVKPVKDPLIVYKPLWNYFHKHAKLVRTRLQVNSNTGNILHNMEVIFA